MKILFFSLLFLAVACAEKKPKAPVYIKSIDDSAQTSPSPSEIEPLDSTPTEPPSTDSPTPSPTPATISSPSPPAGNVPNPSPTITPINGSNWPSLSTILSASACVSCHKVNGVTNNPYWSLSNWTISTFNTIAKRNEFFTRVYQNKTTLSGATASAGYFTLSPNTAVTMFGFLTSIGATVRGPSGLSLTVDPNSSFYVTKTTTAGGGYQLLYYPACRPTISDSNLRHEFFKLMNEPRMIELGL